MPTKFAFRDPNERVLSSKVYTISYAQVRTLEAWLQSNGGKRKKKHKEKDGFETSDVDV